MHRRAAAREHKIAVFVRRLRKPQPRTFEKRRERERAGARCPEPHDYDVVRERSERLARERRTADGILRPRDGVVERQRPTVASGEVVAGELEAQRPDRLVGEGVFVLRDLEALRLERGPRAIGVAGQDALAYLRKLILHLQLNRAVRPAGPKRVLVELHALHARRAVDHRAKPPVPDRQRLVPRARRGIVFERQRRRMATGHRGKRNSEKVLLHVSPLFCWSESATRPPGRFLSSAGDGRRRSRQWAKDRPSRDRHRPRQDRRR